MEAFTYTNATCLTATRPVPRRVDRPPARPRLRLRHLLQLQHAGGDRLRRHDAGQPVPTTSMTAPDASGSPAGRRTARPQSGDPTLSDPAIPDQYCADHQRIHQYRGGHQETWGGVTVNIDNNSVDAPVAPFQLAPEGAFVQPSGRRRDLPDRRRRSDPGHRLGSRSAAPSRCRPCPTSQFALAAQPAARRDLPAERRHRPDLAGGRRASRPTSRPGRRTADRSRASPSTRRRSTTPAPAASGTTSPAATRRSRTTGPTAFGSSATARAVHAGPAATRRAPSATTTCGGAGHVGTARSARWTKPPRWQRTADHRRRRRACGPATRTASRCAPGTGPKPGVRLDRRPLPGPCRLNDRSLARSAGWAAKSRAGFSGRTYLATKRKGASLTRTSARVQPGRRGRRHLPRPAVRWPSSSTASGSAG